MKFEHDQTVKLNIRDNSSDENTRWNALRIPVTSVETELMFAQVSILVHGCNYSGMMRVIDHTSAACFLGKLVAFSICDL